MHTFQNSEGKITKLKKKEGVKSPLDCIIGVETTNPQINFTHDLGQF